MNVRVELPLFWEAEVGGPALSITWRGRGWAAPGRSKLRTCDLPAGLLQGHPPNPPVLPQMEVEGIFQGYS